MRFDAETMSRTLVQMAQTDEAAVELLRSACARRTGTVETPDLLSQHFSDYGNSRRVITLYGDNLRYCHPFGKWLCWDGTRWAVDEGERARGLSQETMLELAGQALKSNNENASRFAAGCLNTHRVSNALREARPALAIQPEELDTNPDLLNFMNGTLELSTGRLREHSRDDLITKLVHHNYDPNAQCPVFARFLSRVTKNHSGLADYLQKAFGYSLTGRTSEKAVFLLHGYGNNGKTTLLVTFFEVFKEYSRLLQIGTLMAQRESTGTQADLADLHGARFVMTSETEEGQRLAEGTLKRITQGMGSIKATRKYENPFQFQETHKLWIDANHLPVIRGTDNAIWNRLHPIPLDATITAAEQDKELHAKLMGEPEGIIAWAIAGASRWYAEGLGRPDDVERMGADWRRDSDQIGRFVSECCVRCGSSAKAKALYLAYRKWADECGERAMPQKDFGTRFRECFEYRHTKSGNFYSGVALTADGIGDER